MQQLPDMLLRGCQIRFLQRNTAWLCLMRRCLQQSLSTHAGCWKGEAQGRSNELSDGGAGEVIKHRNQFIQIDDLENYKRCRVQLHAQGIVLRDIVLGAEIKTKKQQVCRTGEFLVAEIDSKIGGFGIVPSELDGAIVSSHYFLFVTDEIRLDRRFLDFFIRTPYFREQVKAQGSTNYAAIRPSDVLGYKIPLPPLPEQSLIVGRIEELAAKIEEARGLRMKAGEEAKVLFMSSLGTTMESFYNEFQIKAVENLCEQVVDCKHYTPRYCDDG